MKNSKLLSVSLIALLSLVGMLAVWMLATSGNRAPEAPAVEAEVSSSPVRVSIEADGKTFTFENAAGRSIAELLADADVSLQEGDVVSCDLDQVLSGDIVIRVLRKEDDPLVLDIDGKQIALEDMEGKTLSELISESGLVIHEGDILSFNYDQALTGDLALQILAQNNVSILVSGDDPEEELQYHIVLLGGTVQDALQAAGLTLTEDQEINYDLSSSLEDGMQILITAKEEESSEESSTDHYWYGDTTTTTTATESSTQTTTETSSAAESSTAAESSAATETSERVLVSVEVYEDCDGSGHGIKIYTYSDGSQEEVQY